MATIWIQRISKFLKKTSRFVKEMRTEYLVAIPGILGFLIIGSLIIFYKKPFTGKPFEILIVCVIFILWGMGGLIMVFRREMPGLIAPIQGSQAIVVGIFLVIVFWGFALMLLIRLLKLTLGG